MEDLLKKLYTELDSPVSYAGVQKLYAAAKKEAPDITRSEVLDFLEGERVYTMHKPRRLRYERLKVIPSGLYTDMFVDLADMSKLSRFNGGYKWMLVGIECLSRMLFVVPSKGKNPQNMKDAFDRLLALLPAPVWKIFSDRGNEFKAREMKEYFKSKDILKYEGYSTDVKSSMAERAIQSIKGRLYKYFSEKHTLNWVEAIPKIVDGLNHCKCRTTGMRPVDVNKDNWEQLFERLYARDLRPTKKTNDPRLRAGDDVRIASEKGKFDKGYLPRYSDEIFKIKRRLSTRPNTFDVEDQKGEKMLGKFYAQHLARTKGVDETTHRIAKVHRRRTNDGKKEFLVSFMGHSPSIKVWLTEDQLL